MGLPRALAYLTHRLRGTAAAPEDGFGRRKVRVDDLVVGAGVEPERHVLGGEGALRLGQPLQAGGVRRALDRAEPAQVAHHRAGLVRAGEEFQEVDGERLVRGGVGDEQSVRSSGDGTGRARRARHGGHGEEVPARRELLRGAALGAQVGEFQGLQVLHRRLAVQQPGLRGLVAHARTGRLHAVLLELGEVVEGTLVAGVAEGFRTSGAVVVPGQDGGRYLHRVELGEQVPGGPAELVAEGERGAAGRGDAVAGRQQFGKGARLPGDAGLREDLLAVRENLGVHVQRHPVRASAEGERVQRVRLERPPPRSVLEGLRQVGGELAVGELARVPAGPGEVDVGHLPGRGQHRDAVLVRLVADGLEVDADARVPALVRAGRRLEVRGVLRIGPLLQDGEMPARRPVEGEIVRGDADGGLPAPADQQGQQGDEQAAGDGGGSAAHRLSPGGEFGRSVRDIGRGRGGPRRRGRGAGRRRRATCTRPPRTWRRTRPRRRGGGPGGGRGAGRR